MTRREELEKIVGELARELADEIDDRRTGEPFGFLLMLFDFGPNGFTAYASNANREDVTKMLREHLKRTTDRN